MYKAVFDTNVYISAAGFGGKPELLLHLSSGPRKQFQLYTSHDIIKEVLKVLRSEKFKFTKEEIADTIASIDEVADVVEPKTRISVVIDEADNRVLECAVKAKADYIVSGDKHLLDLGEYKKMPVIKPAEFLKLLEKRP